MKKLYQNSRINVKLSSIFLFITLLFSTSCEGQTPVFQIDHLIKTWVYESIESDATDAATSIIIFELDSILKGTEMTFVQDNDGSGTYSTISPNDSNSTTGTGTWLANSSDPVTSISLDQGTADEQLYDVLTLTSTQLHLSSESLNRKLILKFRAK